MSIEISDIALDMIIDKKFVGKTLKEVLKSTPKYEHEHFLKHLEYAEETVNNWPEWKKMHMMLQ